MRKKKHKENVFYKNKLKLLKFQLVQEKKKNQSLIKWPNPLLQELARLQIIEKKQRRYSDELFKVSYLFSIHTSLYEKVIRHFLPFPSKRQVIDHFKNIIEQTQKNLFDLSKIQSTIKILRKKKYNSI